MENEKNTIPEEEWPSWYDGKKIDEILFCISFLKAHPMKCIRGRLFTVDGMVEDEGEIQQMILQEVMGCLTSGISPSSSTMPSTVNRRPRMHFMG